MRKLILAGVTLAAALAVCAGQALAVEEGTPSARRVNYKHRSRIVERHPVRPLAPPPTLFRLPAHPIVRDCVHVTFPQCSRGLDPLNDGTYER